VRSPAPTRLSDSNGDYPVDIRVRAFITLFT
jgi:hypothetical protein